MAVVGICHQEQLGCETRFVLRCFSRPRVGGLLTSCEIQIADNLQGPTFMGIHPQAPPYRRDITVSTVQEMGLRLKTRGIHYAGVIMVALCRR